MIRADEPIRPSLTNAKEPVIRILIVDDQKDSVSFLQCALADRGHAVTMLGTVSAAVAESAAHAYDLVVADLLLPDGNGWELLRLLRQRSPIRGVALSGLGFPADRQRSADAGFSHHLLKPVDIEVLVETIESLSGASTASAGG